MAGRRFRPRAAQQAARRLHRTRRQTFRSVGKTGRAVAPKQPVQPKTVKGGGRG